MECPNPEKTVLGGAGGAAAATGVVGNAGGFPFAGVVGNAGGFPDDAAGVVCPPNPLNAGGEGAGRPPNAVEPDWTAGACPNPEGDD